MSAPRLLSDRIQEFIDWLESETDFVEWDQSVKTEVHKMLITFMISDPIEDRGPTKYESGLCCMAAHANATPPWTCDCLCHRMSNGA